MFEDTNVVEMFPTYLWVYDLEKERSGPICQKIFDSIQRDLPPDNELVGGHSIQSATKMHKKREFKGLMAHVDEAAKNVMKFLGQNPEPLIVTGCWANISGKDAYHKEHSHPNNFLSGVFYVKVPKGGDTINFHDPRSESHIIAPHFENPSMRNISTMFVEAKAGRMMLFPSWLRHSVDPNASNDLRVSISFNLMFRRYTETQSQPRFSGAF